MNRKCDLMHLQLFDNAMLHNPNRGDETGGTYPSLPPTLIFVSIRTECFYWCVNFEELVFDMLETHAKVLAGL